MKQEQEKSVKQEKIQKRKRSDLNITPPRKRKNLNLIKKKTIIMPRKVEEPKRPELSKDFVIDVKKSIKTTVTRDGDIQKPWIS